MVELVGGVSTFPLIFYISRECGKFLPFCLHKIVLSESPLDGLFSFILQIFQKLKPFSVRHVCKTAHAWACFPFLGGFQRRCRDVGNILLCQSVLLAQGFQIIGRVPKLRIFNNKIPLLSISSGAFPRFAGFFGNSRRVFDLLQC